MARRLGDYLLWDCGDSLADAKYALRLSTEELQAEIRKYYDSLAWYSSLALSVGIIKKPDRIRAMEANLVKRLKF